jgi:hypothetical protein
MQGNFTVIPLLFDMVSAEAETSYRGTTILLLSVWIRVFLPSAAPID